MNTKQLLAFILTTLALLASRTAQAEEEPADRVVYGTAGAAFQALFGPGEKNPDAGFAAFVGITFSNPSKWRCDVTFGGGGGIAFRNAAGVGIAEMLLGCTLVSNLSFLFGPAFEIGDKFFSALALGGPALNFLSGGKVYTLVLFGGGGTLCATSTTNGVSTTACVEDARVGLASFVTF
jgi:hypothetical protein